MKSIGLFSWYKTFLIVIGSLTLSAIIIILAIFLGEQSPKLLVMLVLGIGLLVIAMYSQLPKQVFLFSWVFSLTYNRQFFSFEGLVGNQGSSGPYWVLADLFLIVLFAIWIIEYFHLGRRQQPTGYNVIPWYLPYALICLFSIFVADRMDWAAYEFIRTIKVALILFYIRYNFKSREWWIAIAALGAAASIQSLFGILEVATGRTGVLWIIGLQDQLDVPRRFTDESFYGWVRATATMAHPPNLACYLLIAIPVYFSLFVTATRTHLKLGAALVTGVCIVGMAATLSRFPNLLLVFELLALLVLLFLLRYVSVVKSLGLFFIGGLLFMMLALPFSNTIVERMQRDFDRSVDFRFKEYSISTEIWRDNPILGIGLNNYSAHLLDYGSEQSWALDMKIQDIATKQIKVRYISGPLNAYLLAAAETGGLGVLALLLYFCGVSIMAIRAIKYSTGLAGPVVLGLTVGVVAIYLQQLLDYSYWVDPILYTFTLCAGLLALAPELFSTPRAISRENEA